MWQWMNYSCLAYRVGEFIHWFLGSATTREARPDLCDLFSAHYSSFHILSSQLAFFFCLFVIF